MIWINTILPLLEISAAISTGVLAGALLTEAMVLVPYWRKMKPEEFLALHHRMGPSLLRFFAPVTIAGTMLPFVVLIISYGTQSPAKDWWLVVALCAGLLLTIYFAYFKAANQRFEDGSTQATELAGELARWAYWHSLRTIISLVSAIASLLAISQ